MSSVAQVFNILVVEDNEADVFMLRRALKKAGLGFELTVIEDGAEAIDFVTNPAEHAQHPIPDLAVLDLNLPKNTGIEVLEVIRRSAKLGPVTGVHQPYAGHIRGHAGKQPGGADAERGLPLILPVYLTRQGDPAAFNLDFDSCLRQIRHPFLQ